MNTNEVVEKFVQAWESGDPDLVGAMFTPEGTYLNAGTPKPMTKEQIRKMAKGTMERYPDLHFEITNRIINGINGAFEYIMKGTHSGPGPFPPTNKQIAVEGIDIITVENGKIKKLVSYFIDKQLLNQLGCKIEIKLPPNREENKVIMK